MFNTTTEKLVAKRSEQSRQIAINITARTQAKKVNACVQNWVEFNANKTIQTTVRTTVQ